MRLRQPAEHRHPAKRRYRDVRAAGRERHTPISDLHWLISTTAMTVGISVKGDTAPVQVVPADTPSVSCSDDASHLLAARPTASRIGWYDD
jgi:hypothetical protein